MTDEKWKLTLKNPSKNNFFILDIDSTLVTTHQRNQAILNDWVKASSGSFPEDCLQLKKAQCHFGDYGLRDALERIQFKEINQDSKKSLDAFWRTHFFSNTYLHSDLATRGAVDWTQTLEETGVEFVYLTARHKKTMWEGTLSSMDALGFPINEDILFLKEDLSAPDEVYKTKVTQQILQNYNAKNIWLIDNEPVVLQQIKKDHPTINLIFFDSTHSGRAEPPANVPQIKSFHFSSDD